MKDENFFTHFNTNKTESLDDYIQKRNVLESEVSGIDKSIEQLETVKAFLQQQKSKLELELFSLPLDSINKTYQFDCEIITHSEATLLSITMPFRLPIYKKITGKKYDYYRTLNYTYTLPLIEELSANTCLPTFEHAFVLITHYTATNVILDTDNRFHSFIFNALRSTKVIVDDNHSRLSYMENGAVIEDVEAVRVVVCDITNMQKALDYNNICINNLPKIV